MTKRHQTRHLEGQRTRCAIPLRTRTVKFHNTHSLRDVVINACSRHAVRRGQLATNSQLNNPVSQTSSPLGAVFSNFGKTIFCKRVFRKCSIKNRYGRPCMHTEMGHFQNKFGIPTNVRKRFDERPIWACTFSSIDGTLRTFRLRRLRGLAV